MNENNNETITTLTDEELLNSPEAAIIKQEMIRVGRKLWDRQYVDGNGGNISYRIAPNRAICTPTLLSKADLAPEDFCLVDLDGNQMAGKARRTSEIFLHLQIFKSVPEARAAVHAHPPYATAYAISGCVPPNCVIPEQGVFVGPVALTTYETPGTQDFANTIIPYAKDHNTILLGNHGIICWADTVTHAEWYVEIIDTYCRTLMLAAELGKGITLIPAEKQRKILEIKKRLGMRDANDARDGAPLLHQPQFSGEIALPFADGANSHPAKMAAADRGELVKAITEEVLAALDKRGLLGGTAAGKRRRFSPKSPEKKRGVPSRKRS